jgi:hypothetical protein
MYFTPAFVPSVPYISGRGFGSANSLLEVVIVLVATIYIGQVFYVWMLALVGGMLCRKTFFWLHVPIVPLIVGLIKKIRNME